MAKNWQNRLLNGDSLTQKITNGIDIMYTYYQEIK